MTSKAFLDCARVVLAEEGGFSDHPLDPGGRTNLGITQRMLDRARKVIPGLPADVKLLTHGEAIEIYRVLYWDVNRCDELPPAIALMLFDSAVQHAPPSPVKFLQYALGVVPDGEFGPRTYAATRQVHGWEPVLREMAARRMAHYMRLDSIDDVFGLGWARRLLRVYDAAKAML